MIMVIPDITIYFLSISYILFGAIISIKIEITNLFLKGDLKLEIFI